LVLNGYLWLTVAVSDAHADDLLQVQDESAGLVVALLDPQPGEDVLDACAAPGGKALFAAARMRGRVSTPASLAFAVLQV
jgi:16S rRNA C967 or C1407 C5-methylase (RsmB/RsmF family)